MEVVVGDTVLGRATNNARPQAGATALQNAIAAVRKDISSRATPKSSSSMLHGISVVDRKNMTKTEEELMRQLIHIFGGETACRMYSTPRILLCIRITRNRMQWLEIARNRSLLVL